MIVFNYVVVQPFGVASLGYHLQTIIYILLHTSMYYQMSQSLIYCSSRSIL